MLIDLAIAFGRVAFVMLFVLTVAALLGWVERKQSAIMRSTSRSRAVRLASWPASAAGSLRRA